MSFVFLPAREPLASTGLHATCPRLALARDQHNALHSRLLWLRGEASRLESLVGHRDLQLTRSMAKRSAVRNRRYIEVRRGKLGAAEHALHSVEAEARSLARELAA